MDHGSRDQRVLTSIDNGSGGKGSPLLALSRPGRTFGFPPRYLITSTSFRRRWGGLLLAFWLC